MTDNSQGRSVEDYLIDAWWRLKAERQKRMQLTEALSWLRKFPGAYHVVVEHDPQAAEIAAKQKWHAPPL